MATKRRTFTPAQKERRAEQRRRRRNEERMARENATAGVRAQRPSRAQSTRAQAALERTLEDNALALATERMQRNMRDDTLTEQVRQALARRTGITPLEFLMSLLRDPEQPIDVKLDAAKAAAPYCHRKLPLAVEATHTHRLELDPQALASLSVDELTTLRGLLLKTGLVREPKEVIDVVPTAEPAPAAPLPLNLETQEMNETEEDDAA